jgi:NAD(P)-dependent dehydrogenase (short-subunit alcohol dehydrogenase family)
VALFAATEAAFGRVDVLVNNAGTVSRGAIDELSLEDWRRVMDTNLLGPFLCSREAMKIMKRQHGGRIINIGSISAQVPRPNAAPYVASKAGLVGLTKSLALEGRAHGIAASCLHPGNTISDLGFTNPEEGAEPRMSADDVAATVLTMAALPAYANILEAIILPVEQLYIGRG